MSQAHSKPVNTSKGPEPVNAKKITRFSDLTAIEQAQLNWFGPLPSLPPTV